MSAASVEPRIPTPAWIAEALRLLPGVVIVTKFSGTTLKNCWMPEDVVDPATGVVIDERNDYSQVRVGGKSWGAHVAVAIIVFNRFPTRDRGPAENDVVLHLCNNPACRNPSHLKFGTSKEDSEYRVKCGRGPKKGPWTKPVTTAYDESTAVMLLKKYMGKRGAPRAIANYCNTTLQTVENLARKKKHLQADVLDTEIELNFKAWVPLSPAADKVATAARKRSVEKKVEEMRRRFHFAAVVERSVLLSLFIGEYGFTETYVRQILNREVHPDIAPEIPIPQEWGIGRRRSYSRPSAK